jgi:hypothetical protein
MPAVKSGLDSLGKLRELEHQGLRRWPGLTLLDSPGFCAIRTYLGIHSATEKMHVAQAFPAQHERQANPLGPGESAWSGREPANFGR